MAALTVVAPGRRRAHAVAPSSSWWTETGTSREQFAERLTRELPRMTGSVYTGRDTDGDERGNA